MSLLSYERGSVLVCLSLFVPGICLAQVPGAATSRVVIPTPQSAEAATQTALARVQAVDPKVHAVIALDPTALEQARAIDRRGHTHGSLYGYALLVKDNIEVDGPMPTTAGSMALLENVTHRDAPLVARLRVADAVILGKANLSEWANIRSNSSISGWSGVGGQTRNPYALDRDPCGSSSGSAVAVAAGEVVAAIGTETNGSITCPASLNGVVGLKPTVGLVSRSRIIPISHTQDTAGPIAVDVTTAARVLNAIAGSDPTDPATKPADTYRVDYLVGLSPDALRGARVGVLRFAAGWSAGTDAVFERALKVLQMKGATLVEIRDFKHQTEVNEGEGLILQTELKTDLNSYLATTPLAVRTRTLADLIAFNQAHADRELGLFGQDEFLSAESSKGLDDPKYLAAKQRAQQLAGPEGIDAMLAADHLDVLVSPTMPPAWKIDAANGDQIAGGGAGGLAAIAGYPHLTVPMGDVFGLPVGLSFLGRAWSEAKLLAYGYAFEQAAGVTLKPGFVSSIEEISPVREQLEPLFTAIKK